MSYVIAAPEILAAAAADVAGIGSSLSEAHVLAAARRPRWWRPRGTKCRRRSRRCFLDTPGRIRR